jgi:hypothetical protein
MTKFVRHALPDPSGLRRAPRVLVDFETRATGRAGIREVRVVNISPLGLMARTDENILMGERVIFELPHIRTIEAVVRWVEDGRIGTEFVTPVNARDYETMMQFIPLRQTAW